MVPLTPRRSLSPFTVIDTGRIDGQLMRDAAGPSRLRRKKGVEGGRKGERRAFRETREGSNHDRSMVGDRLNDGELGGAVRLTRLG